MKYKILPYTVLTLFIMLPLFWPGYVFALDMVFGPEIRMPSEITASYPFYLLLKVFSFALPVQAIQKILLMLIIMVSGVGAHSLAMYLLKSSKDKVQSSDTQTSDFKPQISLELPAYFAGILYIINPFTYTRFMDGHFAILLGYALLPFFVKALFELLFDKKFSWRTSLRLALYAVIISIVSIHAVGYLVLLALSAFGIFAWQIRRDKPALLSAVKYGGLTIAICLALSSYWIVPTILNDTPREQLVSSFDDRYLLSFRTDGANDWAVIGNTISMNGYWGDREGRYTLPRSVLPLWPVFFGAILALAGYGFYKSKNSLKTQALLISAVIASILAIGIAAEPFKHLTEWLNNVLPFYRGFREPQKFVSILALFYAVLSALGLRHLLESKSFKEYKGWLIAGALVLPFLYTPTMLWGFAGQLKSREYPKDWAQIDHEYINGSKGKTLFLPWHQYMHFDFAGRVIANPGPVYFGRQVIAGDNAEIGLIERQVSTSQTEDIDAYLASRNTERLAALDIEYILLSKNADWREYDYLDNASQLRLIQETEGLKLYRNLAYSSK